MPQFPQFVGQSYESPAYRADVERTINSYAQVVESEGRVASRILLPIPGKSTFAANPASPTRALFAQDGRRFALIGFNFVEIDDVGTITVRGTVLDNGAPGTISSGGDAANQAFIVSGGTGYAYNLLTNVLTAVPAAGIGLVQGGYLDGYFWALDSTSTFHLSNLLDPLTWDPLQVALRNDASDRWMAGLTIGKYIWLWGSRTTCVLYDAGTFPFPFAIVPGVLINRGVGAAFSVADVNGSPVWVEQNAGGGRMVMMGDGFGAPKRISHHGVEDKLQAYSTVSDAVATSYEWEGHLFYQINFPTANASWAFDALSGEWHEPLFWNTATGGTWDCSHLQHHCFDGTRHLVGDRLSGTIYALSTSVYTDAGGAALRRLRRCPFPRVLKSSDYLALLSLQILMDVGIGLAVGQGIDPQVMMRISRDGGKTWGPEHWTTAGAMGKYLTRAVWNRCGRFRDGMGVLEVVVSDPVPFRFIGAEFDVKRLAA